MGTKKHLILFFTLSFLFFSCGSSKEQADDGGPASETKSASVSEGSKGKVTDAKLEDYSHLDGCHFMLITPDDKKLYPLNLDTAYHEDGLKVRVRYRKKDAMTTCMAGTNVKILAIERRD